jgi:predicted nucleic acid-binding protein
MLAVADTGPLHYLILIGHADLFGQLLERVLIPDAVHGELCNPGAPASVRNWIASPPPWLSADPVPSAALDTVDASLDDGERAAIALAVQVRSDLVLMDDRAGVAVAQAKGFVVTGTLGLLVRGARRGLLDLPTALDALGQTNFHWTAALRHRILAEHGRSTA